MEKSEDIVISKNEKHKLITKKGLQNSEKTNNYRSKKYRNIKYNKNNLKGDIFKISIYVCLFIFLLLLSYQIYLIINYSSKNSIINNNTSTKEELKNITKEEFNNITQKELEIANKISEKYESKNKIEELKSEEDSSKTRLNKNNITKESLKKNDIINYKKKKVGLIGVENDQNPGNNLIKYAMSTKLKEYGLDPIVIARIKRNNRIDFLSKTVKLKIIKDNFKELKKEDYDILMINSDLSWTFSNRKHFYDNAFLKFSQNWDTPKFIYGASMGTMNWFYTKQDDAMAKKLLKNFTGISFREIGTERMAEEHLGIKAVFVLDPTFLLDKSYYLDLIKNYKRDFDFNKKYIMIYQLDNNIKIRKFINDAINKLNFTIYEVSHQDEYYVENFIFAMNISQAVISDSFHGSIFSIIFNKPFISFINYGRGGQRFVSLKDTFNLNNRIIDSKNSNPNLNLLLEPLNINNTRLEELKNISINFLKKNLGVVN